jgi:hypothetical protein
VLDAGQRHGCTQEDIYGCLYFYLTEQLRLFVRRLKTFNITITLFDMEACELASALKEQGTTASASTSVFPSSFDRIALSNITDENYVGLRKSLTAWAPLLSPSSSAVIIAYFMNWVFLQPDGRVRDAGKNAIKNATQKYMEKTKVGTQSCCRTQVVTLDAHSSRKDTTTFGPTCRSLVSSPCGFHALRKGYTNRLKSKANHSRLAADDGCRRSLL